jgi:hypothetical protein
MNWHRYVYAGCLGFSVPGFIIGTWHRDFTQLSLAFVFLSIGWMYREMYLGWNQEKKSWKFIKRPEAQP